MPIPLLTGFPARFPLCFIAMVAVAVMLPQAALEPLIRYTANAAGMVLNVAGYRPRVSGDIITLDGFSIRIIAECTPLYMVLLFTSFVLAAGTTLQEKLAGIICGSLFLDAANTIRIAFLSWAGSRYRDLFLYSHAYLGEVVMIAILVAACLVWERRLLAKPAGREGLLCFFIRVAGWSGILFMGWVFVNVSYVKAGDAIIRKAFALAGNPIEFIYSQPLHFQTFNVVIFAALVLATPLPPRRKAVNILAGGAVLGAGHLAFRLTNVFLSAHEVAAAFPVSVAITVLGEYLLPLMLWQAIGRGEKDVSDSGRHIFMRQRYLVQVDEKERTE